jgi:hypothetical protein
MLGKALFWLGVIVVVLWILHHPAQASGDVHSVGDFLSSLSS